MLLVDDLLLFPVRSVLWIFREIHNAAQEELATESETVSAELRDLYMRLETGKISEQEFEEGEKVLLERLDIVQRRTRSVDADEGEEEERDQMVERKIA